MRKRFSGFITGHPLEKYREKLLDFSALTTDEVASLKLFDCRDGILIGGVLGTSACKVEEG